MRRLLTAACVASLFTASAAQATDAARQLAQDAVIVDTHIDAPGALLDHWNDLGHASPTTEFDFPRAREGGLDVAFMSIYTSADQDTNGQAWQVAHTQIDAIEALVARHPEKFALLLSPDDVERGRAAGKVLLALGMENGAPITDDLSQLAKFHARGVRYMTLAHSRNNRISDSSYELTKRWNGLSPFGEQVVARMNDVGIMVDVSHLSDESIVDVLRLSRVPVIASHSGMRHFTPGFERNLSDELAAAIASKGGVVQLVFGSAFIDAGMAADIQAYFRAKAQLHLDNAAAVTAGQPERSVAEFETSWDAAHPPAATQLDAVLDQVDHAVKVMGIDHVGIGSDFDGVSGNLPEGLRSVADYPNLVAGLQGRGYSEADIRKILGTNLLRAWRAVEAGALSES